MNTSNEAIMNKQCPIFRQQDELGGIREMSLYLQLWLSHKFNLLLSWMSLLKPPTGWLYIFQVIISHHWFSEWLCAVRHYSITWTNVDLAPVPLSIFRSNSKFDENSERSSFEYTRPITTIFCTRHDSETVVTCAKYLCDRRRIFYIRVFWIFIEFRIRSKYA